MDDKITKHIINTSKFNKTGKKMLSKFLTVLLIKLEDNKIGQYSSIPSKYFKKFGHNYSNYIKYLIKMDIIEYYKRPFIDENDLFNDRYRKYYGADIGVCMKYRLTKNFLNLVKKKHIIKFIFRNKKLVINKNIKAFYVKVKKSLQELGFKQPWIKKDSFSGRLHHEGIKDYKKTFKNYYQIDAICSQPTILYYYFGKNGVKDHIYNSFFQNKDDFYVNLCNSFKDNYNIELNREEAKKLFTQWLNSDVNQYYKYKNEITNLFRTASKRLNLMKKFNYKECCAQIQRIEKEIWIDDLLENIPTEFAVPIHDSLIVKQKDANKVLNYCEEKYPNIKFKLEMI